MSNCSTCGKFHNHGPGSAWKMVHSGYPPTPDRELSRCLKCVEKYGPFNPQSGIKPEYSCGIVQPNSKVTE
jgi:hypothetical protein